MRLDSHLNKLFHQSQEATNNNTQTRSPAFIKVKSMELFAHVRARIWKKELPLDLEKTAILHTSTSKIRARMLTVLRGSFRPSMVASRDPVWIAQQLNLEGVEVGGTNKLGWEGQVSGPEPGAGPVTRHPQPPAAAFRKPDTIGKGKSRAKDTSTARSDPQNG